MLTYLEDDGIKIEPEYYMPVLPMVLINGAQGIGTGYSTQVPSYDPKVVIEAVRGWIKRQDRPGGALGVMWKPWYRGFTGTIEAIGNGVAQCSSGAIGNGVAQCSSGAIDDGKKLRSRGTLEIVSTNKVRVTELPLGVWTEDFKEALEALIAGTPDIKSYSNDSSESKVDFTLTFTNGAVAKAWTAPEERSCSLSRLETQLKMSSSKGLAMTNMHLFDPSGRIKKYESPDDIINDFCEVRLKGYEARRTHMIAACAEEVKVLSNRARFIEMVNSGELKLGNRGDEELDADLEARGFDRITAATAEAEAEADGGSSGGFSYLLGMKLSSLTQKRKEQLEALLADRQAKLRALEASTPVEIWLEDIEDLQRLLIK